MGRRGWDGGKHRSPGIPPIPPYQIAQALKSNFAHFILYTSTFKLEVQQSGSIISAKSIWAYLYLSLVNCPQLPGSSHCSKVELLYCTTQILIFLKTFSTDILILPVAIRKCYVIFYGEEFLILSLCAQLYFVIPLHSPFTSPTPPGFWSVMKLRLIFFFLNFFSCLTFLVIQIYSWHIYLFQPKINNVFPKNLLGFIPIQKFYSTYPPPKKKIFFSKKKILCIHMGRVIHFSLYLNLSYLTNISEIVR